MVSFMAVAGFPECPPLAGDGGPHPFRGAQSWRRILPETRPGDKRKKLQVCGSEAVRLKTAAALC